MKSPDDDRTRRRRVCACLLRSEYDAVRGEVLKTAEMDPDIRAGSAIYTRDGQHLGEVGEIEGGAFSSSA